MVIHLIYVASAAKPIVEGGFSLTSFDNFSNDPEPHLL